MFEGDLRAAQLPRFQKYRLAGKPLKYQVYSLLKIGIVAAFAFGFYAETQHGVLWPLSASIGLILFHYFKEALERPWVPLGSAFLSAIMYFGFEFFSAYNFVSPAVLIFLLLQFSKSEKQIAEMAQNELEKNR